MSPEKALYSLNSHERHVSPDLQNAYLRMTNCMKISDSVLMPRAMRYIFPMVNILLIRHRGWSSLCMKRVMSYNKVQVWYIPTG